MNNILGKINKAYELEAQKTELGKHEVELGSIDELTSLMNKSLTLYSDMLNKNTAIKPNIEKAKIESKKALTSLNEYINHVEQEKKILVQVEAKLKDLGLDPRTILKEKYAQVEKIKSFKASDWQNWKNDYNSIIQLQYKSLQS